MPLRYVNEYARLELDLGHIEKAEKLQQDAVASCRAALGDSHPETLISLTHMAGLLRAQNKPAQAEPIAREVLAGWKAIEAGERVRRNTLTSSNILAELLHTQGKDAEAEPLTREVLGGFVEALGPKHPYSVSAAENLAGVLTKLGRESEALAVLNKFGLSELRCPIGEEGGAVGAQNGVRAHADETDKFLAGDVD